MKLERLLAATAVAAALCASQAAASTLAGKTVSINLTTSQGDQGTQSILVGSGEDGNYYADQFFDFNAGAAGDHFTIRSSGSYCGMTTCGGGTVTFTLSNLDFGTPLTAFNILSSIGGATVLSLTSNSVSFAWSETAIPSGTYFDAQFVTGASAVPLPATLPILGSAFLGFAALRRRQRKAA